ncbi:MAG: 16S rRNA (cytosine(1402)-N(4))-methyltransferase RsmH [Planctomycetota bacterium]|nr:16S rRNA (cytosine(1402)-N(4))-methyltransferase RsmH [Planctomycetota bacterium]
MDSKKPEDLHEAVLFDAVCDYLAGPDRHWIADLTVGMGGHSLGLLERSPAAQLIAFDHDPLAIAQAQKRLAKFPERVQFQNAPFESFAKIVQDSEFGPFDSILADLGVSSMQLDQPERGFSFRFEAPLDMRMGPHMKQSAAELLASESEEEIARILYEYGDEPASRKIAAAVVKARLLGPIETTGEFADLVRRFARSPRSKSKKKIDPATRSFQALRIAVNDELGVIERTLPQLLEALKPGGRVGVISFHSLEDRIVKRQFKAWAKSGRGHLITPKPRTATPEEIQANPRSRSARLRVFERHA